MADPVTLCPLLTAAAIAKPKPMEVGRVAVIGATPGVPDRPETEAVVCQGKQCMLFITQVDEKGVEVGGRCAITMIPIAMGHLHSAITKLSPPVEDPTKPKN